MSITKLNPLLSSDPFTLSRRNSRTMQTASSSSLPPRKPNTAGPPHPLPPSTKHPQTPPKCVKSPPKEIKRIDDPKKCSTAFSKRHKSILNKVDELSKRTGAHVAVIMFSPKGKLHYFGKPSVEEVFSEYLSHNSRTMQTASSSSLPPRKPRNTAGPPHPLPPSIKHPQTPPCVKSPPKEIKRIDDPKKCSTAFSKRHKSILNKADELFKLTGAHVAVIMFSPKGKLHYFGKPSVEEVFSEYLSHNGSVMPPMSLSEWMEEWNSCATKEDWAASIKALEDTLDQLLKECKDFENNPSVNAGAGDDSGVGVDRSSKVSNDDKIVDCDSSSTLLVDSAAGCGSSGVGLVRSDLESVGYDDKETYVELDDFIDLEDLDVSL